MSNRTKDLLTALAKVTHDGFEMYGNGLIYFKETDGERVYVAANHTGFMFPFNILSGKPESVLRDFLNEEPSWEVTRKYFSGESV